LQRTHRQSLRSFLFAAELDIVRLPMKKAHWSLVVLLGGSAFAFIFISAGVVLSAIQVFVLHRWDPKMGDASANFGVAVYLTLIGAALGAAAFVVITAAFGSWRALTPQRTVAFSLPAGALAFLLHFVGLASPLSRLFAPRHLVPLASVALELLVPGFLTGLLAAVALLTLQRIWRVAAT
jgi:hypothetical protein